ncbi:hypothetical protein GLV89_01790 [Halomonas alkaliantarctica]|nr:hypothetical protein [Halomonas alkaliantarctica]
MATYTNATIRIGDKTIEGQEVEITGGGSSTTYGAKGDQFRAVKPKNVLWHRGAQHYGKVSLENVCIYDAEGAVVAEGTLRNPECETVEMGNVSFEI